jgi:Archaeal fructose-1,6-bisphosphatase and related enzymes of inositol monophosphatase family
MSLEYTALEQLCNTAKQAAIAAGNHIAGVDRSTLLVEHKASGSSLASQVVTEVDRHCDQLINRYLLERGNHANLALLSEESAEHHNQQTKNRFNQPYYWCIDPLDGTLPFTQGKAGYAVSIALVSQTGTPVIGVVYDPVNNTLYSAIKNGGAFKNGKPIQVAKPGTDSDGTLTVYADNSFKTAAHYLTTQNSLTKIAAELGTNGYTEIYGNGAVKNACAVLSNPLACYFKFPKATTGGGSVWDFSATACIIQEAGGWVSGFYGEPLNLNPKGSTFMNQQGVIFTSGKGIAEAIMSLRENNFWV